MNRKYAKVSVILLTYNSKSKLSHFFDNSLKSILLNNYPSLHLIVVDNGSRDDTVSYVKKRLKKFARVIPFEILMLNKNYGWGRGNNKGAILAKDSDFLFFLNDDVILEKGCIFKLVTIMNKNVRLGAVQPLMINEDGTAFCGAEISLTGLPRAIASPRGRVFECFYASGAALLTRTKYFFEVGMFDEDLFLYRDDVDYCWRLRLARYKVVCLSTAKARHYVGATLGKDNPLFEYYFFRNNIWLLIKNCNAKYIPFRLFLFLIETLMIIVISLLSKDYLKTTYITRGFLDGMKGLSIAINNRKGVKRINENELNKMFKPTIDVGLFIFTVLSLFRATRKLIERIRVKLLTKMRVAHIHVLLLKIIGFGTNKSARREASY
jgi:hypothetical protein